MKKQIFTYLTIVSTVLLGFTFFHSLTASAGTNVNGFPDGLPCSGGGPDYRNHMAGSFPVRFDRIGTDTRYSPGFDAAWHAQCSNPSASGALQNLFNTLRSDISSGIITKCTASDTVTLDGNGNIKLCSDEADSYITVTGGNWVWSYYDTGGGGTPPQPAAPPTGTTTLSFPCRTAIYGSFGLYANEASGGNFNMQSSSVGPNETFNFIDLGGNKFAIQSTVTGKYANAAGSNGTENFNMQSTSVGQRETFTFIGFGEDKFAIKSYVGRYAFTEGANFYINSANIGQAETFILAPISGCIASLEGAPFQPQPIVTPPTQGLPTDLGQLIQQIFTWSLAVLGIAVFVMVFYAGFLWLTAAGNTAKVSEAKSRITNAVFGAILLLSSYLILNTINPNFVRNSFNLPGLGEQNIPPPGGNEDTCEEQPLSADSLLSDLQAERSKYGDVLTHDEAGALLNAVAWKNKDAGWVLLLKTGGNRCNQKPGGPPVSCDWLIHTPSQLGADVLIGAPGTEEDGTLVPGPATPTWPSGWCPGEGGSTDRWVAPVQP